MLLVDFNHPNICWRVTTAGYKKWRRFLTQAVEKPARRGALLDLIQARKGWLWYERQRQPWLQ